MYAAEKRKEPFAICFAVFWVQVGGIVEDWDHGDEKVGYAYGRDGGDTTVIAMGEEGNGEGEAGRGKKSG